MATVELNVNTADTIDTFVRSIFPYAGSGWMMLRSFLQDGEECVEREGEPIRGEPDLDDLSLKMRLFVEVWDAADRPMVACTAASTIRHRHHAKAEDIKQVVALAVDLDRDPDYAQQVLEGVLGPATLVAYSGSRWSDATHPYTPKRHLWWRLCEPAGTEQEIERAKRLYALAVDLANEGTERKKPRADRSILSLVHPLRIPGSLNRKWGREPVRSSIHIARPGVEIDIEDAIDRLESAFAARNLALPKTEPGKRSVGPGTPGRAKTLESDDLAALAATIAPEDEWNEWNLVGMAFWAASGGSDDGLAAFDEWSARADNYDPKGCKKRWKAYDKSPPDRVTIGTLIHKAREVKPRFVLPSTEIPLSSIFSGVLS